MNSFQKNPFKQTTISKAIKPIKQISEKDKIQNIKEQMAKIKTQTPKQEQKINQPKISITDKINILKNIDRYK